MSTDKPRVGFIGLGLMGHGMAKNLAAKGFPLTVRVHRNRKAAEDILAAGAREARTNAELANSSDVVILCVTGSPQVEEIVYGENGIHGVAREGLARAFDETAVRDAGWAHRLAGAAREAAVEMQGGGSVRRIDAPGGDRAHEVQPAARRLRLEARDPVGGARLETEPAVDAKLEAPRVDGRPHPSGTLPGARTPRGSKRLLSA